MVFRRSSSSRARSFKPRSRFTRNRTHQPRKTGHWQRANLFIDSENIVTEEAAPTLTVSVLAQIIDHLATTTTAAGDVYNNQVKFLEIGGIVFDWQMMLTDLVVDFPTTQTSIWRINNQVLLVSDRLDETGIPVALNSNWFSSTTPVPLAASTQDQDEDQRFPTRVHWRHARTIAGGYSQFPDVAGDFQPSQSVVSLQGSANLRLRLALDDEHCLAFHWTSLIAQGSPPVTAAAINLSVNGSIYYRVRMQ